MFLDTSYDGESFFVDQASFVGAGYPYERIPVRTGGNRHTRVALTPRYLRVFQWSAASRSRTARRV